MSTRLAPDLIAPVQIPAVERYTPIRLDDEDVRAAAVKATLEGDAPTQRVLGGRDACAAITGAERRVPDPDAGFRLGRGGWHGTIRLFTGPFAQVPLSETGIFGDLFLVIPVREALERTILTQLRLAGRERARFWRKRRQHKRMALSLRSMRAISSAV